MNEKEQKAFDEALIDVLSDPLNNLPPQETPQVFIIGAQPGSGKSELQRNIQININPDCVVCNTDEMREFYPNAHQLKHQSNSKIRFLFFELLHRKSYLQNSETFLFSSLKNIN